VTPTKHTTLKEHYSTSGILLALEPVGVLLSMSAWATFNISLMDYVKNKNCQVQLTLLYSKATC